MPRARCTRRDLGFLSLGMLLTFAVGAAYLALMSTRAAAAASRAAPSSTREISTLIITREGKELRSEFKGGESSLAPVVVKGSGVVARRRRLAGTPSSSSSMGNQPEDGLAQAGDIIVTRSELYGLRLSLSLTEGAELEQLTPEAVLETEEEVEGAGERGLNAEALLSACEGDKTKAAWAEWRSCIDRAATGDRQGVGGFYGALLLHQQPEGGSSPWPWDPSVANMTAVLLHPPHEEDGRRIGAVLRNMLDNLPVDWRVQVVGSRPVLASVAESWPVETALGKVLLTHDALPHPDKTAEDQEAHQRRAALMRSPRLYESLSGDTWLFFGLGSAICSAQRRKLPAFLHDETVGWWAAPSSGGDGEGASKACGHGRFSLRRRRVVEQVLSRSGDDGEGDDEWFCRGMQGLSLQPPPPHVAAGFAVHGVMDLAPFAVHEPWEELGPLSSEMRWLVGPCPELLDALPTPVAERPDWQALLLSLDPRQPVELEADEAVATQQ